MARTNSRRSPATMLGVRLHGPKNLRVERIPRPGTPGRGQALVRVKATGICGSDLHCYLDARIGDTPIGRPLVLGRILRRGRSGWPGVVRRTLRTAQARDARGGGSGAALWALRALRTRPPESVLSPPFLWQLPLRRQLVRMDAHARAQLLSRFAHD